MYNFNHLYYFYVTAKSPGMKEAAKHLHISQPSLSSQLKVLESALDVRLFHRVGRNNKLSPAGTVIFGFCRQMFEISEEMGELISQQVPTAARRVHIGVSEEVDRPFVIEVVSLFLKKHGLVQRPKVSVVSGTHEQLAERLRFRELDAIVTQSATIDPELENLERAEVPVGLICPRQWKVPAKFKSMKAAEILKTIAGGEDAQWLMPAIRFKLRTETDMFFETNHLKGRVVFESDVIASLVRSVIDEIGVTFLPLIYVAREIREKSVRVLGPKEGYWKYRVWLACHTQNHRDPLLKALAQCFKEISEFSN